MKSFSWTLALRYLNPLRTFVSVITLISLLGVAFGVMVLIVVLSVHNGFERNLKDTLLGHSPHLSVYYRGGNISEWSEEEERLAKEPGVKSAYALVEGFALLDSKNWQRPVYFRAFNTENEGQIEALRGLLDPDYPESSVDFNPPIGDAMAAPDLAPPPLSSDVEGGEIPVLAPILDGEIFADRHCVVSSQLAAALGVGPGDEIRVISASNLDQVMEVYSYPNERAWDLYSDVFETFQVSVDRMFKKVGEQEQVNSSELTAALQGLEMLLPRPVETPDGVVYEEGEKMRPAEEQLVREIFLELETAGTLEKGIRSFETGTQALVQERLTALRELDLEKADNQKFKDIEEFVVPKTLRVQGVYKVSERTQGPDLFIPITIGMELKGLTAAESIGLRIEEPYEAGVFESVIQKRLGPDWVVQSWMKMHADRFQLVKTEKIMMSFALSFITLLSAFSIMAVMYTVTVQKRQEIGVMKALGATPSQIVRVFVYQGFIVGIGGALSGLAMGLLAVKYREGIMAVIRGFGVDPFPPEFHGMSELPAHIESPQLWVICIVAVILCLLAALVPALMAAFRDPARSLRNL